MKNEFFLHDRVQLKGEPTDWNLGTIAGFKPVDIVLVRWDDDSKSEAKASDLFVVSNAKSAPVPASDPVEHPAHYQHPSGIEVIQITKYESFLRGNVAKYLLRAPYKGSELEDLRKARQYLDWEIERVEGLAA